MKPHDELTAPGQPLTKLAFTRCEAAKIISVSPPTIDRLAARGLLRPSRATRRPIYSLQELERFLRETTAESNEHVTSTRHHFFLRFACGGGRHRVRGKCFYQTGAPTQVGAHRPPIRLGYAPAYRGQCSDIARSVGFRQVGGMEREAEQERR